MIFFGKKAKTIATEFVPAISCAKCGNSNTTYVSVVGRYFHVYWIPFFPTGKLVLGVCENCKHTTEEKDMPSQMKGQAVDLKNRTKQPFWFFSGLGLVVVIVTAVSIIGSKDDDADRKSIEMPTAGDKYHIKTEDLDYTIMKVSKVVGDTVFVIPNIYSTNKISGLYKIDKEKNYNEEFETGIHKDRIKEMYAEKTIIEVDN